MTLLHSARLLARRIGIEVTRYNPAYSLSARTAKLLAHHNIDAVLDVGANDGGYGKFIRSTGFNGNIISFEPQAEAYKNLLIASHADPAWYVAPRMALGDIESELEINVAANSASSSLLKMLPSHIEAAPQSQYINKEKVAVHRLDAVDHLAINDACRIYLKIDTQGYEMPVLLGAAGIMEKTVGIQLEMSVIPLYEGQALYQELLNWLAHAGFEMWRVEPGFMNQVTGRMLQFDAIFFRK